MSSRDVELIFFYAFRVLDEIYKYFYGMGSGKSNSYSSKISGILSRTGLRDSDFFDRNPTSRFSNGEQWRLKINTIRNETMHQTHVYDVDVLDKKEKKEISQFTVHLLDFLVRAVLKTIGYRGSYTPRQATPQTEKPVDWVDPAKTTLKELGYD